MSLKTGFKSCSCWPLKYKNQEFGVISIHSKKVGCFTDEEISFLQTVIADITLALYTQDMTRRMQIESDFNREIVDTMEVNTQIGVATSVQYFYETGEIANAGGKLTVWGNRKYYIETSDVDYNKVTFLTGCALMIKMDVICIFFIG